MLICKTRCEAVGSTILTWKLGYANQKARIQTAEQKGGKIVGLRFDQRVPGFVYVLRSLDPTWYNRIKVGLSVDPIERSRQLYTTGVPFPFVPYYAWAVTDMAYAERIAHVVLDDHRLMNSREHFDVIPVHRRMVCLDRLEPPTMDEVMCCLDTLLELIEIEYECSKLLGHYSVDVEQLNDYSRQRKRTAKDPNNPNAYGPLFYSPPH